MDPYDIWQHAVDGATREDARNLDPRFLAMLQQFYGAAPEDIRDDLLIMSAYRSPQRQAEIYNAAVAKYGSPEAARKWAAPPGRSNHNKGLAIDFRYATPEAREWAHANLAAHGLALPMSYEPWHVEPAWARSGKGPAMDGAAAGLDYPARSGAGLSMGAPVEAAGLEPPTMQDRMDRAATLFGYAAELMD